jgi:aldehyde dehydrogenase family 7 protein A1
LIVSFTGSEKVGKEVAKNVQDRFGKVLLELGGNNGELVRVDILLSRHIPREVVPAQRMNDGET